VVGHEVEVEVGHVGPDLQGPGRLALPGRLGVSGIVNGKEVARVTGRDQGPIRHVADGDVGVGPLVAAEYIRSDAVLQSFEDRTIATRSRRARTKCRRPPPQITPHRVSLLCERNEPGQRGRRTEGARYFTGTA